MEKVNARYAVLSRGIVRLLIEGRNYSQIAEELGVDRKTVYTVRQSQEFEAFFNDTLDRKLREIDELDRSGVGCLRVEALKERRVRRVNETA